MRILLGVILCTVGMFGLSQHVMATDFTIDEITVRTAWQKDGVLSSNYELRTQVEADWFQLQSAAKVYGSGNNYYALSNSITLEKYLKNFEFDLGTEESADYSLINFGTDFQTQVLEKWWVGVDYAVENRMPKGNKGSYYHDDSEQVELKYQGSPFQYGVRFRRQEKEYPVNTQYTSLKYTIENSIEWEPSPVFGLEANYQEDSGAYPYRVNQNFWKDKWSFGGHWTPAKSWTLEWDYSTQEWFKGFFPYRRDSWYQSEVHLKPDSFSEWSLSVSWHGLAYCDTDNPLLNPGEWLTDETKSRLEEKINLEYGLRRGIFSWSLGYFIEKADYQSGAVTDKQDSGFYTSFGWNFKKISLVFGMTPGGSIGNRYSRYQINIGYHPLN